MSARQERRALAHNNAFEPTPPARLEAGASCIIVGARAAGPLTSFRAAKLINVVRAGVMSQTVRVSTGRSLRSSCGMCLRGRERRLGSLVAAALVSAGLMFGAYAWADLDPALDPGGAAARLWWFGRLVPGLLVLVAVSLESNSFARLCLLSGSAALGASVQL